jgi:hypothetical protein
MAVLRIIAQQVIRRVSGGDQSRDSKLDLREVTRYMLQILNEQIKIDYLTNIKIEDDHGVSGQYMFVATATILKDNTRDEFYITLPTAYSALPHEKGLHEISPTNGKCATFIPCRNGSRALFKGLPAGNLEGNIGYYPERDKVWFVTNPKKKGVDKVMIKLIVGVNDDVVIDPGTEKMLVDKAVEFFSNRPPQDRINDNVDQQ